jgi:hypothetical protein
LRTSRIGDAVQNRFSNKKMLPELSRQISL